MPERRLFRQRGEDQDSGNLTLNQCLSWSRRDVYPNRVGTDAFVRPSQAKLGRFPGGWREFLILQAQEKKGQTREGEGYWNGKTATPRPAVPFGRTGERGPGCSSSAGSECKAKNSSVRTGAVLTSALMNASNTSMLSQVAVDQTTTRHEEGLSTGQQERLQRNLSLTCWALSVLLIVGLGVTIAEVRSQFAAALLWALACLAVGSIGGFLFAIPRVPRSSTPGKVAENSTSSSETSVTSRTVEHGFGLGINTNLEEISDWLTKILVGVGLIQLRTLPDNVRRVGNFVGQGLGVNQQSVASGIVIYFLGLGFLGGYLLTRMFLGPAFRLADQATTSGLEEKLEETHALAVAAQAASQAADKQGAVNSDLETAVGELNKPDHPPARIDQLIVTLQEHRKAAPLHRKLNIVLARLYGEGKRNFDDAIRVLQEFIDQKRSAHQEKDADTADAFFNIACYYSQKMEEATADIRNKLEDEGINAIKSSLEILPQNAADVLVDRDLTELRKSSRLQELLKSVKEPLSNNAN